MTNPVTDIHIRDPWRLRSAVWTDADTRALTEYLASHDLVTGKGTTEGTCSLGAINLAQTNTLTDMVPECMSAVIGRWIIRVQDRMPDQIRNSAEWKALLPSAAATGRDMSDEGRRINLLIDWVWAEPMTRVLPSVAGLGFEEEWKTMIRIRNIDRASMPRLYRIYFNPPTTPQLSMIFNDLMFKAYRATRGDIQDQVRADRVGDATYLAAKAPVWSSESEAWKAFDPVKLLERLIQA